VRLTRLSITILVTCIVGTAIGRQQATSKPSLPDDQYVLGADSRPQVGVPEGPEAMRWLWRDYPR
jgi:hypothetical protein